MKSLNHKSEENITPSKKSYINCVSVIVLILLIAAMITSNGLACLLGGTALLFAGYSLPALMLTIEQQAQELHDQHDQVMAQHDLIAELVTLSSDIPPRADISSDS